MDIESYELACSINGTDPNNLPDVSTQPELLGKGIIALVKLSAIEKATNEGWVADFSNISQLKYTGWLVWSPSLGVFVFTATGYTGTLTGLGARFWFADRSTARYFTEQHIELINDLHNSKI